MESSRSFLRVLIVEDSEDDAKIQVRFLERAGFRIEHERVETAAALKSALARKTWDAVIADYHLPEMTGMDVLRLFKETGADIPFVLVSGSVGEDALAAVMAEGASDFVAKSALARLPAALGTQLEKAAARAALREQQDRLRLLTDNVPAMIAYIDAQGRYRYANLRYRMFYTGSDASIEGRRIDETIRPEAWAAARPKIEEALGGR